MKIRSILTISWLMAGWAMVGVASDDPFAEPDGAGQNTEAASPFAPDDVIEDVGPEDDPFAPSGYGWGSVILRIPAARLAEKRDSLQVRVEIWEVSKAELVLEMDDFKGPEGLERWRKSLLKTVAKQLVHAPVVVVDAKSKNSVEGIVERIYPTEYEPPEMLPDKAIEQLMAAREPKSLQEVISMVTSSATPTAFETRNTGASLEVAIQPVTGEEDCWDLSLVFEDVVLAEMEHHGAEGLEVKMPNFTVFRTGGLSRVAEGRWHLVSAMAPPRCHGAGKEGMSWVTMVRVDPAR